MKGEHELKLLLFYQLSPREPGLTQLIPHHIFPPDFWHDLLPLHQLSDASTSKVNLDNTEMSIMRRIFWFTMGSSSVTEVLCLRTQHQDDCRCNRLIDDKDWKSSNYLLTHQRLRSVDVCIFPYDARSSVLSLQFVTSEQK